MKTTAPLSAAFNLRRVHLLVGLLVATVSGCASTPTHWVDTTGQARPHWQFKETDAACTQQALQVENGQLPHANSPSGPLPAAAAAAEAVGDMIGSVSAYASGKAAYKLCMEQAGWEPKNGPNPAYSPPASYQPSPPHPRSAAESLVSGDFSSVRTITLPDYPFFYSSGNNEMELHGDGEVTLKAIKNYKVKVAIIPNEAIQSVVQSIKFRCDSDIETIQAEQFYSGENATGELVKQINDTRQVKLENHSSEEEFHEYACFYVKDSQALAP